ncbi:phage tail protein, partial [Pseudomonas juntendi]|uniref:phage tail protein n=1 Tax=Pseudomonas juntendi TaxID=2666183 RepID=UPI002449FBE4
AKQKQPSIASNSVPSIATVRMLYLWSWGPIVGPVNGLRSVKLDGTPVMAEDGTLTYPGVKWQFRSGELNQERMTGISESSNEIAVGQQLLSTTPYVYTITNSMLDAVRLRFSWPQLQSQDSGGNIDGVRIEYAVDVSTDNGPFQQVLASEVNRKNVTKYERSHRIDLPAGSRWAIRARRITPEANSSLVQDGMYVEAIAEVVDSDQEYPLTAVSCVEYDAEQFGGDIAKIAVLMRGRIVRVPINYDPVNRTYATSGPGTTNGVWDGTFKESYTNNPAWVFFDLALHPYYGLGDRIDATMINRWSLYRIGQYCDQLVPNGLGGQEPRFTCNLYLQKQAEAWAVLQDLAAIFHGLAFWDGSQITVNADMPQDPVYNYTLSQILDDGAVKYTGSKLRDRHSQAMVSFDDPDRGYDTDKEPVFDESAIAEYGVREISVEAVGCTSRGQAQRAGQWALMTEQLQLRGASFRVGLDGYIPKPGKVITLSDPMLAGRANGGRIAAVAGRVVTVDRDIEVPTGARLLVNLPSGKSEARQVRSVAGRQITVMADFSEAPQPECGWVLDFDDLKLMQFYVRNVTRPEWHQFQLECIQYEPSKFDAIDYGTVIDDRPISVLPPGVQDAPARVLIGSHSSVDQGMAVTTMTISWDAAPGAVAYDVEWRWGSRDWVKVPRTGELAADVRGVYAGQYLARVRAVSSMDVSSIPTNSMLTNVAGKTTPPPAVTHLTTESLLFGIKVMWGFPAGAEDTQRTELWYSEGTDLEAATKLADLAYPQNEHVMQGLRAGQRFFFWARLVDRTGNLGPFFPIAPTFISGTASADASPILEQIAGEILESHLGKELTDRIDLIDKDGPGSVNERLGEVRSDLNEQIADVNNAVADVDSALNQAKQDLQQQIDTIADLADSMPYRPDQAYTAGQSVLGEDGKLYQAKVNVPAGNAPPNATYWTDIGQAVQAANGMAARVQTVETKVETLEGVTTAQSQQITGLQSSLTTTNGNVAAAQQAAEAAATLAGGKGKVIVQSAAPAAADRLAQNLWIDTTGNANTPKRWSGTAWVAVTDKVATDAAAAAANALAVAQTKADASVVQNLTTRVTEAEGSLSSQSQAITGLNNSLTTTNQNVTAAQQAAQAAATAAGAKGEVIYGSTAPAADKRLAQNLWIDTTSNANTPKRWNGSAWVAVTDKVATDAAAAAASALTQVATKAESSVVQTLTGRVTDAEGKLTTQSQAITGLQNSLTTTNQNVTAAQQAAQAASDAAGAKGKVLYQSTAPAVADRLTQNLWIDTTSNANTPKRWNGSAWVAVTDKVATDAAAAAANALSQVATKADASTVQSLTNTVEQQGAAITANGQALTSINASLAQAGGENLFYNPSFERVGSTAGLADGWTTGTPAGVTRTASLVASTLDPSGKAQRYDVSGIDNASRYLDTYHSPKFPAVSAGQFVSVSIYVKVTAGCLIRWYLQPRNAAGTTIVTQTPGNIVATGEWQRLVFEGREMPAGTVACPVIFRVFGASSTPQDAVVEIDRAQFEIGRIATGWRDNGQLAGADVAANASATTALAGRVTATETGLTAASGQITDLNNSIGDVGGENLFYNPTFTKAGTGGDIADGWATEGPATSVESLVTSWLNAGEKAVRVEVSSVGTGTPYKSLRPTGGTKDRRPMVAEGQTVAASIFLRGTAGLGFRFFIQWINAAGTVISAPNSVMFTITAAGKREQFSAVAPAGAVTCYVYLRIYSATGAVTAGYVEMARPQFEYGPRATGWRNNGQVNAVNNSATSAAVDSLTSTVDQQGSTLSSVAGRTTSLENSLTTTNQNVTAAQQAAQAAATAAGAKGEVIYGSTAPAADKRLAQNLWIDTTGNANTPKRWSGTAWVAVTDKVATDAAAAAASALSQVATKAEASAVNSLTNRVSTAEGTITSQSTDITQLKNSIGAAQPFVAGMTWEFTNSTRGWVATATGGTITAGPLFATVTKNPNLQCNFTPTVSGAQNPYLRIRLRRRNTTRSGAQMYWANEDGGLSEARRMAWAISTTTTDWQDIEIDLSGHAGWNGKNMYAIRLDMMNSADTTGEIDIAYIAVGRRSAAASAQAVASLESNVTQQGGKLTAEGLRIDGLYASVGDADAAIQNEAKARADADGALSQQIQTTQSSLGATNASVQQISTAQTGLNNRVNAQFSIKVAVTQSGVYALGGIGVGIQNQNGVLQSVVAVLADQFAVINAAGNGYVSPFAIQGGQVFMNDAFIRDGSIINAKIANGAITSAKIGVAEIDTLRIRGNAVTVPVSASSPGNVLGAGVGQWQNLVAVGVHMDEGGFITAQYSCYQGFGSGIRKYQFQMDINGLVIAEGGGDWADGFPNLTGSIGVGPGYFVITVKWWGENTGVGVRNHNLFAMGTKR